MNDALVTLLILVTTGAVILFARHTYKSWSIPPTPVYRTQTEHWRELDSSPPKAKSPGLMAFFDVLFQLALLIGAIYALFVAPVVTLLALILLVLIAR